MSHRTELDSRGVLVVKLGGAQTGASLKARRKELIAGNEPARVYVVDYTRSLVIASGDELDAIVLQNRSPIPGAVIVSAQLEPMFHEHSRRMAAHGITRSIFTDARQAMAWALEQRAMA